MAYIVAEDKEDFYKRQGSRSSFTKQVKDWLPFVHKVLEIPDTHRIETFYFAPDKIEASQNHFLYLIKVFYDNHFNSHVDDEYLSSNFQQIQNLLDEILDLMDPILEIQFVYSESCSLKSYNLQSKVEASVFDEAVCEVGFEKIVNWLRRLDEINVCKEYFVSFDRYANFEQCIFKCKAFLCYLMEIKISQIKQDATEQFSPFFGYYVAKEQYKKLEHFSE